MNLIKLIDIIFVINLIKEIVMSIDNIQSHFNSLSIEEENNIKHVHGLGGQFVKGMNLTCKVDQKGRKHLLFSINHVHRKRLNRMLGAFGNVEEALSENEFRKIAKQEGLNLSRMYVINNKAHKKQMTLSSPWDGFGPALVFSFETLGKLYIGFNVLANLLKNSTFKQREAQRRLNNYFPSQLNKINIILDNEAPLVEAEKMLKVLGLSSALTPSSEKENEKLKLGHFLHNFYPKIAYQLERSESFFDLSVDELVEELEKEYPEKQIKKTYDFWKPKMEARDTLPGKKQLAFTGLAESLKEQGVYGLTTTIGDQASYKEIASILKHGLMSTETRKLYNISTTESLTGRINFKRNSADCVFTQLVTKETDSTDKIYYNRRFRILIDPKRLEQGSYQYYNNNRGSRTNKAYRNRRSITSFVKGNLKNKSQVMLKDSILPQYITGMLISNDLQSHFFTKRLINHLRSEGIIKQDLMGNEMILGKKLSQFFHFGNSLKKEYFRPSKSLQIQSRL